MVLPNCWSLTIAIWIITPFFRMCVAYDTPGAVVKNKVFLSLCIDSGHNLCYNICTIRRNVQKRILPDYGVPFYTIDRQMSMGFFIFAVIFLPSGLFSFTNSTRGRFASSEPASFALFFGCFFLWHRSPVPTIENRPLSRDFWRRKGNRVPIMALC